MVAINGKVGHPWNDLEDDFQAVFGHHVNGCPVAMDELRKATERIATQASATALRLLTKLNGRAATAEAYDVAQDLFIALLEGGFARSQGRPAYPFAFATLKYICFASVRNTRRRRSLIEGFELADDSASPLEQMLELEAAELVASAISGLNHRRRNAVEERLARRSLKQHSAKTDAKERRRQASLFYHAREEIKAKLAAYRHLDS